MSPPSEGVVVERLRAEATLWISAVSPQAERINRRHSKAGLQANEVTALEVDLHFFLTALVRLERCISRAGAYVSGLSDPLAARVDAFRSVLPAFPKLRDTSEHIDEYNLDIGRDRTVPRQSVQSWYLDSVIAGEPVRCNRHEECPLRPAEPGSAKCGSMPAASSSTPVRRLAACG